MVLTIPSSSQRGASRVIEAEKLLSGCIHSHNQVDTEQRKIFALGIGQ